jgi:hypothetical protein
MPLPDPTTAPPWHDSLREPTDLEMAKWLLATSPENRNLWFGRWRENRDQANHCLMGDHDNRMQWLQRELEQARKRIAWLETHYQQPAAKPESW